MRRLGAKISQFNRFLKDQSGNMAVVVALSALPLMMAGGAAVDYGNWISVQARLQAATDAAALAAGREANLGEEELRRVATDYFMSNFGTPRNSGTPNMTMTLDGAGKVRIDANVTVDNYLLKTIGKQSQYITASAEVSKEATGLEVVLVFDNTGSMGSQSRLSTLKVAANDFVEILFGPRDEADTLKVAVVPFSQFVNVGPDKSNRLWLDTGGANRYSNDNFDSTNSSYHNWAAWQDLRNRSWPGCVESRPGAHSVSDTTPNPNIPDTLFPPAFAPDEPGSSTSSSTVNGNRYYNSYISDMESRRRRNNVVWRQENSRKYRNVNVATTSRGPDRGCNIQPIQALTNQKAPVLETIRNMRADGYTHVAEGVGWGLRVLSPGEPFTEGVSYDNQDITKAMVLLTDGENTFDSESNHNGSTYTAYGFLNQARLGSSNYWTAINAQNTLLRDACNNVKAEDIVVYSFAYNVPSATQRNLIKSCASSPEKYFDPPSNAALVRNFQQIADELRRLHLSQ
jgi:Flp pilus assembly protein TadG